MNKADLKNKILEEFEKLSVDGVEKSLLKDDMSCEYSGKRLKDFILKVIDQTAESIVESLELDEKETIVESDNTCGWCHKDIASDDHAFFCMAGAVDTRKEEIKQSLSDWGEDGK